ncbi:MFS transporter [Aneurinibacillus terranovensis]|uniref:MFS transporter n=1 Tax=Aneurinibacillus terranovensis TaxID=278991 RepID=UPI00040BD0D8|nr:MFS transporter [Aneurinibacillus terranovensis]
MKKDKLTLNKSKTRWLVLFMICLMYLITFMDRTNISVVAPSMSKEFGFDQVTMGFIFSAFTWAYALGQIPGGWLGDRFGPRSVLTMIVSFWSLMTIVTAQSVGYLSMVVVRFLFGFGEAGAFPTATKAMKLWLSKSERGFAQGITHSFSRFGAAIVPPIAVSITVAWGWRAVFYIFGAAGFIWAILFYVVYRNIPEEHKWVNQGELEHIRGFDKDGVINTATDFTNKLQVPWKTVFASPNMWFIMIAYFCYNYAVYFFMTWLPTYLVDYRHFSLSKMGLIASLPLFAGMIGDTVGGILTDKILEKTNNIKLARKVVAIPGLLLAAIFLIPASITVNPYTAVYCLAASMFFLECVIAPSCALPMDVGGPYSGTVYGVMSMAGNSGGAVSAIVFGALTQHGYWTAPFTVEAVLLVIGASIWLFLIQPDKPVVDKGMVLGDQSETIVS